MRYHDDDPDRRTRLRLDLLVALLVLNIIISISLWVDRYRGREQPTQQVATQTQTQPQGGDYLGEGANPPSQSSQMTDTRLPESQPAMQPAAQPAVSPATQAPPAQPAAAPQIKVQILNGCGKTGIAKKAREFLTKNEYDVRDVGNADRQDYRFSEVLNRSGSATAARDLAQLLGIDPSRVKKKPAAPGLDVDLTIIIGADHRRLPFGH